MDPSRIEVVEVGRSVRIEVPAIVLIFPLEGRPILVGTGDGASVARIVAELDDAWSSAVEQILEAYTQPRD